uniref:Uncharacterized protein n=1 Tax=Rhizophagus irregularis (strain DAOM 181602 / DAOM 197198 / MUCL 43194) TaxID=747089 RepID=U9UVL2_RHIID
MSDIDQFLHEVTAQLKSTGYGLSLASGRDVWQVLWDNFATCAYTLYGNMGDDTELECPSIDDKLSTSLSKPCNTPPILPDVKITPVDQSVTPETS